MRAAFVILVTLAFARGAWAQASLADRKAAQKHYRASEALVKQQRFDEAIRELETAYELDPQPTHVYNLGVAHHLRGDDAIAAAYYRMYLLDTRTGSDVRKAEGYLAQLETKLEEVHAEKVRKELAEVAAAKASQGGSSVVENEMYARYTAETEMQEKALAAVDAELKTTDAQIDDIESELKRTHAATSATLDEGRRWERYARRAPSGDGRIRRILGTLLLGTGTALIMMGVQDLNARDPDINRPDDANLFIAGGAGTVIGGLVFLLWGESAGRLRRTPGTFTRMQLMPTLGSSSTGLELVGTF